MEFQPHLTKYIQAREEYKNEQIEDGVVVLTADMQRVLVLPKLDTKDHLFVSRLVTFNSFKIECAASSKTIEVIEMGLGDFHDITKGNRSSTQNLPALKLKGIVQVTFREGNSTFLVKSSFLDSSTEVEFLRKNLGKVLPSIVPTRRRITRAKKPVSLTKDISSEDRDW